MLSESTLIKIINQLHEINKRSRRDQLTAIERCGDRVNNLLEEDGIIVHNPLGERYDSSRTDCEANILSANRSKELTVTDVIKPVVYISKNGKRELIQQGLVIVE